MTTGSFAHAGAAAAAARFLVNGREHRYAGDWSRTVLDYLRLEAGLVGTKEGCGEGDCGACAVIVCERDAGGTLGLRAINSCLAFVPALDGKYVLTVEGLSDGALHPVQERMVALHASQCGYCTPGFVIALVAFAAGAARDESAPKGDGTDAIHDALAGNLCRCTGYRPIVDAARAAKADGRAWWLARAPAIAEALRRLEAPAAVRSDAAYFAPTTIAGLCALLESRPEARIVAGATDLGLAVAKHGLRPPAAVSVAGIAELRRIEAGTDAIRVGAAATLTDLLPVVEPLYPGLGTLLRRFGSPQIRNLATIGGNLCTASPIGDLAPALLALDATLTLRSARGARAMAIEEFFTGYRRTALAPGEFLEAVTLPRLAAGDVFRVYKLSKRYDQDISTVCAGLRLRLDGGRIAAARIAMGGMAETPKRARAAERTLEGRAFDADAIEEAIPRLAEDFAPISDVRGGAEYRRIAAANLLRRFWLEAAPGRAAPATEVMAP
jgi:xanthine dehydrogenase small subunit